MADLNPLFGIPPADSAIRGPSMQPQQQGGMGGFLQGDAFGNMLTAAGISLMGSPRNAPLSNFGPALQNAQTAMFRQQQADLEAQQREEEKQRRAELAQYAMGIVHPSLRSLAQNQPEVALKLNEQMQPAAPDYTANQKDYLFALQNGYQGGFEDWVRGGGGAVTRANQPTWLIDENGNVVPGQMGNDGTIAASTLPAGYSAVDPRALAGERAFGTAEGKWNQEQVASAPQAIATAQQTLSQIRALKEDPGLWWSVGGMGWTPNVAGNPQAGTISRIEQLQGGAFLQAFESLKGGGQITEIEGTKATNAIARLQRSQSYEEFVQALSELEEVVNSGMQRAYEQAQQGGGRPAPRPNGQTTPNTGGQTSSGLTWSLE